MKTVFCKFRSIILNLCSKLFMRKRKGKVDWSGDQITEFIRTLQIIQNVDPESFQRFLDELAQIRKGVM